MENYLKVKVKILLIDDDSGDNELLRAYLTDVENFTYDLTAVSSLAKAETALAEQEFSIVIMDLSLITTKGIETYRALKDFQVDIPVLIITGLDDQKVGLQAINEGAQDYLVKGQFDGKTVVQAIRYAIARHQIENKLQRSEERFRKLINENSDGMIVIDNQNKIRFINPSAQRLFTGIESKIGSRFGYPVSRDNTLVIEVEGAQDKIKTIECRSSGIIWENEEALLVSLRDFSEIKEIEANLRQTNAELRRLKANLEREVADTVKMMMNKDSMLISQSRQVLTGEMVSNISNQWKQPLNSLSMIIQTIKDSYDYMELTSEKLNEKVRLSVELIEYLARTIDDFRDYFRPGKQTQLFDLGILIEKTINLVEYSFEADMVRIELDLADGCYVTGYPNEYSQAFLNLLINAREIIKERNIADPQRRVVVRLFQEKGRNVVTVEDFAGGISEENLGKIFEPYFTTKKEKGTGVGLFMTRNIIEKNMNGKLTAVNTSKGAIFRIEI